MEDAKADLMIHSLWTKAIPALKSFYEMQPWWTVVQPEIKERLNRILDNLPVTAVNFCDTFYALFAWECTKRLLEGESFVKLEDIQDDIAQTSISEECYQCGINPTKIILDLDDWVRPKDYDVFACMMLCHKIETLMHSIEELRGIDAETNN